MTEKDNIGKKTSRWVSAFLLVMFIIYILVSLGKTDWIIWIAVIFGFFITGFLILQAGLVEYFRKKEYREIGIGDFIVFLSVAVAVAVFMNSLLLINIIKEQTPQAIITFATSTGVFVGIVGGILSIVHLIMPRFK